MLCCCDAAQSNNEIALVPVLSVSDVAFKDSASKPIAKAVVVTSKAETLKAAVEEAQLIQPEQSSGASKPDASKLELDKPELAKPEPSRSEAKQSEVDQKVTETATKEQSSKSLATTFIVSVEKSADARFGLTLCTMDTSVCLVRGVQEGHLINQWNAKAASNMKVNPLDSLMAINGQSGNSIQLISMLQAAVGPTQLTFKRPHELKLTLSKGGGLGFSLNYVPESVGLIVTEIHDGAVKSWNEANPGSPVKVGMRIVSVNGNEVPPATLFEHIKASDKLDLRLLSWR